MNTQHIHELTLRLCQGLDQNYDVVNMDSVMAVISSLEGSPVTKEQLEATRLAKFINHLRRRTKDENLARRAKSLLKKWREMVGIQQQQVVDITQVKSLTGLTSVAGLNTKLYGQYHTLRPRKETVEKAMNFDANHHSSNSNSNQINNVPAVTAVISDVIPSLTNIPSDPIMSTEISQVQQRDDKSQGQYNFLKSGATARNGMQPTSFENVLSCFGVTENMSVIGEGFTNEKANKSELQLRPYISNTYIIDHSSHSNSEKSRSPYITPDVIDIQDSNSCSNLSTLMPNKTSSTGINTCLAKTVFSLCSKSKKVKKEKKRKEKNYYSKTNIVGGIKDTSILLNNTLSNHAHPPPPGENFEKLDGLVYREKFQSTNAEIPSLLDNSSMCSMFLPEGSTNTTEQIKNQASLDLSTTDLTFSGKFKKTKSAISTPSNILFCQNTQVQGHQDVLKLHLPCAENTPILPEYDSETTAIALKALPRKRGRKKGSKGVDSIIAKEGGRSSQRLITLLGNGNKKVKTTKELYAEMQNRKMGAKSAMSPPILGWAALQQQKETSRPTSSGSENSLQSPRIFDACATNVMCTAVMGTTRIEVSTNTVKDFKDEDDSSSETITSEPSCDSLAIPKYVKHHSISIESSSNSQLNTSKGIIVNSRTNTINQKYTNENNLHEILKNLPPVQSISAIESKYEAESIPCTCKVSKIIPMNSTLYDRSTENGTAEKISGTRVSGYTEETEDIPCMKVNIRNGNVCNVGTAAQQQVLLQSPLLVQAKPKKSIFDFDFDEDDDPLYSLKAEATIAANLKKESTQTSNKAVYQLDLDTNDLSFSPIERTELTDNKMAEETLNKPLIQEVCPIYKIEEDPFCIAKQHFDQQTQRITKLHLDALHNFLIPNVNGNWDVRSLDEIKSKKYIDINYEITDNVVPKYNFLTVESMQDNLSKISHFKSSMPKNVQTSTDQLCAIPFLGVTHTPPINSLGKIISNHKACHREDSAILGSSSVNTVYRVLPDLMNCSSDSNSVPSSKTEITSKECTNTTNILVKSPDVACNLEVKNKVNKDFDDIEVNIAGKGKDFLQLSAQNIQNFLKPVERMDNFSASFTNTPVNLTNLPRLLKKKYDTDIEPQHRFLGQSQPSMESLFGSEITNDISHKPLKNLLATDLSADAINMWNVNKMSLSTNIDKYMCITSTLNQMQTPLNLKRKFQGSSVDIRAEKVHRHKRCSRRRFYNDTTESNAKRNKIAINGSSKISNEGIRKQLTDGFVNSNVDVHDKVVVKKVDYESDSPSKTHYVTPPVIISNNMEGCQSGINKSTTAFTIQNSNIPSYTYKQQIDLNSCIMRSKMGEVVEGKIVLAKNSINIENTATNDFVPCRAKSIYEDNAMCSSISESKRPHTVAKCLRNIKPHRKLFFPREIFFKDYDGTKRSILNISSCSSSCTELSEHDDSNDSFTAASSCEPKINTQASFEGRSELSKGMNETYGNNSSAVQLWKRLSPSCTYSNNNKLSTIAVDNNEDNDVVISECVEKQFIKNLKYPIPNNDSKIKDGHMLAGTIDINMNCNPKGANNSLFETPNDIYFTAGKVEASTIFISQYNDIISENVWADNTVACPSSVDDNLQEQNFSNKSCDGYNVFYDKTRITNLISSYTNEPSLFKTFIWNKQNCMNSEIQLQDDSVLNLCADDKSIHNVCREQIKHNTYKRSGHNCNFYNNKTSTESKDCASHDGQVTYSCQENNGNYARLQLFREWHQVLQLRSYNDELITVLPYVVFD